MKCYILYTHSDHQENNNFDILVILLFKTNFSRYAEDVESRLRSIGLVCNIGYPPPELSTIEVVDRIARCGTLYAIVVSSQNVTHQSCTLNVLFGTRQGEKHFIKSELLNFFNYSLTSLTRNFSYCNIIFSFHFRFFIWLNLKKLFPLSIWSIYFGWFHLNANS